MNECDVYLFVMKTRVRMEGRIIAPSYVQTHLALSSDAWREKHIFLCSFSLRIYETSQPNQKDSK